MCKPKVSLAVVGHCPCPAGFRIVPVKVKRLAEVRYRKFGIASFKPLSATQEMLNGRMAVVFIMAGVRQVHRFGEVPGGFCKTPQIKQAFPHKETAVAMVWRVHEDCDGSAVISCEKELRRFVMPQGGVIRRPARCRQEFSIENRVLAVGGNIGRSRYAALQKVPSVRRLVVEMILKQRLAVGGKRVAAPAQRAECFRQPQVLRGRLVMVVVGMEIAGQWPLCTCTLQAGACPRIITFTEIIRSDGHDKD